MTSLLAGALWLDRVPVPALALVLLGALAAGYVVAMWDRAEPAWRPAVGLPRFASWWFVVFSLPLAWFFTWAVGTGALLWLPVALVLSPVGTFLLRDRHAVAGVMLKLFVLVPPSIVTLCSAESVGPWMVGTGVVSLLLALAIAGAALQAHGSGSAATAGEGAPMRSAEARPGLVPAPSPATRRSAGNLAALSDDAATA